MEISWGRALWRNFWASPRLVQTRPHHFLNRKSVNFPHQPFRRWLVAGSGIYFHSGDGPEMLPAAPRWSVGYRSGIHRHDQRGTCS